MDMNYEKLREIEEIDSGAVYDPGMMPDTKIKHDEPPVFGYLMFTQASVSEEQAHRLNEKFLEAQIEIYKMVEIYKVKKHIAEIEQKYSTN